MYGMMANLLTLNMQLDLVYALISTGILLTIYIITKDFYVLTNHKGIKYFRNAFLFLALAQIFNVINNFMMLQTTLGPNTVHSMRMYHLLSYSIFSFITSIGILNLFFSSVYKRLNGFLRKESTIYLLAIILFLPILIFTNYKLFLLVQICILALIIILNTIFNKKNNKKMQAIYGLFIMFWATGIFTNNLNPWLLGIKIISYIIAIIIISIITFKINKIVNIKN